MRTLVGDQGYCLGSAHVFDPILPAPHPHAHEQEARYSLEAEPEVFTECCSYSTGSSHSLEWVGWEELVRPQIFRQPTRTERFTRPIRRRSRVGGMSK